jgi:hypothetical protein
MVAIAGALEMNLVGHRDRDLTAGGKLGQRFVIENVPAAGGIQAALRVTGRRGGRPGGG